MNRLGKIMISLTVFFVIGLTSFIIESCQSDITIETDENFTSGDFMKCYEETIDGILSHNISLSPQSRATVVSPTISTTEYTTVYFNFPKNTEPKYKDLSNISNANDILQLTKVVGASISFNKEDLYTHSIQLSNQEATKALNPMIKESKIYLRNKGFTEKDIQNMLQENNADEAELVPFVLACIEREKNEEANLLSNNSVSFSSFFVASANAAINWGKVGDCAMHAIGMDIFYGMTQSTLKTWGVAALKKAFKAIATKVLGPIGAAIAVADFAWCYTH